MEHNACGDLAVTTNQHEDRALVRPELLGAVALAVLMPFGLGCGASAQPAAEVSEKSGTADTQPAASPSDEAEATPKAPSESNQTPTEDLQPVDTLGRTLSGLESLSFGMSKEMVRSKVSVPLEEGSGDTLNSEFLTGGELLQTAHFPVMPNETKPVQLVFRNGTLFGVCVRIGTLSPNQYLQMLELLKKHFGQGGRLVGDRESLMAATQAFEEGRSHKRIAFTYDNDRVVAQLTWDEASRSSVVDLVFKKRQEAAAMNPLELWRKHRRTLGIDNDDS